MTAPESDSFPRQNARTLRFTLGRPRSFHVSADGDTVLFVRSTTGTDRLGRLWRWTLGGGEVELVDPARLLAGADEELSADERARRERAREAAGGIVGYSIDTHATRAAFALSGRLFVTEVATGESREVVSTSGGAVIDPRLDPTGRRVAYVVGGRLCMTDLETDVASVLSPDESDTDVQWGIADFISAEELDRSRGFWWSPEGDRLLAQRTDDSPVSTWYVSSPADPRSAPVAQRYPAAGTSNPSVSLWLLDLDGTTRAVPSPPWAEYLATVSWSQRGMPIAAYLDREQQRMTWVAIDPEDSSTTELRTLTGAQWVDIAPGSGSWDSAGRLLTIEVADDTYALHADGVPISPPGLQVRSIVDAGDDDVLVVASRDAGDSEVWGISDDTCNRVSVSGGWSLAARSAKTVVLVTANLDRPLPRTTITTPDGDYEVRSFADAPMSEPRVSLIPGDAGRPRIAVLVPRGHEPGSTTLPVLMDPYGGPHHARVAHHQGAFRESQWFADQGFAVVVVDGRGTPGSPAWERGVRDDFASPVLDDQITGLHAAAHTFPDLDLSRVAIRGWSFGGYLSALAVIDRPDVFHAGIAGAPVTDWRLYDTGYTERYLGVPVDAEPDSVAVYERSSLLTRAPSLSRPLQIIHGLADDNVFVAHSLQLSQVLTENGRPHEVIPLSGITHMATQEDVAENLLLLQVEFLRRSLGLDVVG